MRNRYLLLLGFFAFVCPIFLAPMHVTGMQAPAQTFTVRGTVSRIGSAEPIPEVQLTIATTRGGVSLQTIQTLQRTIDTSRGLGVEVSPAVLTLLETQQAALRGGVSAPVQLSAVSDRDGHFVFENLPAGQYTIQATREGYFGPPTIIGTPSTLVQTPLTLAAGQAPADISISMTPGAAISGTAVDSEGRPVVAASAQVYRVNYQNGLPLLQTVVTQSTTDDRGSYRIFRIPPGDYYLEVTPSTARGLLPIARGGPPPKQGLIRTFYPDAREAKTARLISLRGGEDRSGMTVVVSTSPLITVSGTVVSNVPLQSRQGPRGNSIAQSVALTLVPHDTNAIDTSSLRNAGSANMDAPNNGQFQLTGVAPGSYDLFARFANPATTATSPNQVRTEPNYYFGRRSVEAGSQDLQGVTVEMNQGVELKAFATIDGSAAAASGNLRINLVSVDSGRYLPLYAPSIANQVLTGPDGSLTIPFVYEGTYRLQVNINAAAALAAGTAGARGQRGAALGPSLRDAYVEDIREGGVSVFDNGLAVGKRAPQPIEVIVKTNGGIIEGDVYDAQQLKSGAAVVLAPVQSNRQNIALYKSATTNAMGHFGMRGIKPGQYKLFAFDGPQSQPYQNADFLSKYEERGQSITVNASATTNAQVTVIRP